MAIVFIKAIETHIEQRLGYCCGRHNHVVLMRTVDVFVISITKDTKKDNLGCSVPKIDRIKIHIQTHMSW